DRGEPGRLVGPLFALGAFFALTSLWVNEIVIMLPGLDAMRWDLRTLVVVTLDFLIPGTILGMIGPVVAKLAVEHARRSGSALGDVYFSGAGGSIVGAFLTGFILIYEAPSSTIVTLVGAAILVLAALMLRSISALLVALVGVVLLALGSVPQLLNQIAWPPIVLGKVTVNPAALGGYALSFILAL